MLTGYCGSTLASTSTKTSDTQCDMTCKGSNSQYCGAGNRMQVYRLGGSAGTTSSGATPSTSSVLSVSSIISSDSVSMSASDIAQTSSTSSPSTSSSSASPTGLADWTSLGCYSEVPGRALQGKARADDTMRNEVCAAFCSGYKYFATEYASECFCGNTLVSGAEPVSDGRCNMPCIADSKEICGGPNGLSLYQAKPSNASTTSTSGASSESSTPTSSTAPTGPTVVPSASGYISLGCHSEVPNGRALANVYANDSMTIELCAAQAVRKPHAFFGVEYGCECWFGDELAAEAQPIGQERCGFKCPGDPGEFCGAGNALQLYRYAAENVTTPRGQQQSKTTSSAVAASSLSTTGEASDVRSALTPADSSGPAPFTSGSSGAPTAISSTSSSATASTKPLACPRSNGTVYQTSNATTTFNFIIECSLDHAGGDMRGAGTYVESLEACVGKVSFLFAKKKHPLVPG